jgi:hypothetical protein
VALRFLLVGFWVLGAKKRLSGSLATFLTVESSYAFRFIQSITLIMFILDGDAVLRTGDDVAVPV